MDVVDYPNSNVLKRQHNDNNQVLFDRDNEIQNRNCSSSFNLILLINKITFNLKQRGFE